MRFRVWPLIALALTTLLASAQPVLVGPQFDLQAELASADRSNTTLRPVDLRCEYATQPLGIGPRAPRLSWAALGGGRNVAQSAYQLQVATTPQALAAGAPLTWDSGRVADGDSQFRPYGGPPLPSATRLHWRVRIWDQDGRVTGWSAPTWFETGLLGRGDWQAEWVRAPGANEGEWGGAQWIWAPGAGEAVGHRLFRSVMHIAADTQIDSAQLRITVDDQFVAWLNGTEIARSSGQIDAWRQPVTVDVTDHIQAGANVLAIDAENTGNAAGLLARLVVNRPGGTETLISNNQWKTNPNAAGDAWRTWGFDDSGWANAVVAAEVGGAPWGSAPLSGGALPPVSYLRRDFELADAPTRARLYITALGLYRASLNGQPVTDTTLAPEWTDYRRRVEVQTYDVTHLLRTGANTLGAMLGDGWWAGHVGLGGRQRYGPVPLLLAQLVIEDAQGRVTRVVTDGNWTTRTGPIAYSDLLMGEGYDAREALAGWDQPGAPTDGWDRVVASPLDSQPAALNWPLGPPIRVLQTLPVIELTEPAPGRWTFDLGQNMVGHARLRVRAPEGTKLTMRFAEILNPDGTIYTTNLRSARQTDEYTCSGNGLEVWEPTFTFHGFRYVEVTGLDERPAADMIEGVVIGSDIPKIGEFECSDPRLNQLQSNIFWGQRGNFVSVPTDCPQRDERLGWTGDAQIFAPTAAFNNQVGGFLTKWLVDLVDAQGANGAFPDVAPRVAAGEGTAAWGDAGTIVPWALYQAYGDKQILADVYPAMKRWIAYLEQHSNNLLRPEAGYGDWLAIGSNTPRDVLGTAFFARSVQLTAETARVLGLLDEARAHQMLWNRVVNAFRAAYVQPDGTIKGDTQTVYVLALAFDLLPDNLRPLALGHLVDDIEGRGDRLSTGFVSVGHLLPVLSRFGREDVAWRLLVQEAFPSWLFSVKHGATTIWERWDGWTPENGFQDPGMNSFNHYSFGSCGEWMYAHTLGLRATQPGYREVTIEPRPGGGVTWARGNLRTGYGLLGVDWRLTDDGRMALIATVPVGVKAKIVLPPGTYSVTPDAPASDYTVLRDPDRTIVEVGSGQWRFVP